MSVFIRIHRKPQLSAFWISEPTKVDAIQSLRATVLASPSPHDPSAPFPLAALQFFRIQAIDGDDVVYIRKSETEKHGERAYLNELTGILTTGEQRLDRTSTGTWSVFGGQLRFDLRDSVPFLTTKQLAWRTVLKELLWFIRGSTDSKELEAQGVNIWRANSTREFLDGRGLTEYEEGDIGPMYGHALRHFGAPYTDCHAPYAGKDQLTDLIQGLKTDPWSRRHLMTTFNPAVLDTCALHPCHGIAIQYYVSTNREDDTKKDLSCHVYCRSQDAFLGRPFNIASYAILTYIVAKLADMAPKELIMSTGDLHVYSNHVDQVWEQVSRPPLPFPRLVVSDAILTKPLEAIGIDDFKLEGYICHPHIHADMAV